LKSAQIVQVFILFSVIVSLLFEIFAVALLKGIWRLSLFDALLFLKVLLFFINLLHLKYITHGSCCNSIVTVKTNWVNLLLCYFLFAEQYSDIHCLLVLSPLLFFSLMWRTSVEVTLGSSWAKMLDFKYMVINHGLWWPHFTPVLLDDIDFTAPVKWVLPACLVPSSSL
jgi:hypothetical protein